MIDFSKDYVFVKINAKEDTLTAKQYGIVGFPTVVLLDSGGNEIDRFWGYLGPESFVKQIEDYKAGIGTFTSVKKELEEDPDDVHLLFEVAERYYSRGKFAEAINHYEKVFWYDQWNEKRKSDRAIRDIGILYLKNKKFDKAIDQFQRMMDTYPNSDLVPDAFVYKGYVYQKWGKKEKAISMYESFIEQYPNSEDVEWAQEQIEKLKGEE